MLEFSLADRRAYVDLHLQGTTFLQFGVTGKKQLQRFSILLLHCRDERVGIDLEAEAEEKRQRLDIVVADCSPGASIRRSVATGLERQPGLRRELVDRRRKVLVDLAMRRSAPRGGRRLRDLALFAPARLRSDIE